MREDEPHASCVAIQADRKSKDAASAGVEQRRGGSAPALDQEDADLMDLHFGEEDAGGAEVATSGQATGTNSAKTPAYLQARALVQAAGMLPCGSLRFLLTIYICCSVVLAKLNVVETSTPMNAHAKSGGRFGLFTNAWHTHQLYVAVA